MTRLAFLSLLGAALAAPVAASAHSYKIGAIEIGHVWAPPSTDGATSVFGPLLNTGSAPDRLVGASAKAATSVAIRDKHDDRLVTVDSLALPPGKPVSLAPWGARIAVAGLKQPLKEGASFALTLRFAKAGTITVDVLVQTTAHEP